LTDTPAAGQVCQLSLSPTSKGYETSEIYRSEAGFEDACDLK
jgi:hypothetical protein